ncbi:MAG: hypothetical protein IKO80_07100 [Lachnospiraceae bacterium]|nr:hypothetical protein [Lachnospiraceae bacterium]
MFRLWVKLMAENRLLRDLVVTDDGPDNRTRKIKKAIDRACVEFDLPRPIWLSSTVEEFKQHDKCRFTGDAFMESIPFDYMEIQVLEE